MMNGSATTEIYTLSLHDSLPICAVPPPPGHRTGPPARRPPTPSRWGFPECLSAAGRQIPPAGRPGLGCGRLGRPTVVAPRASTLRVGGSPVDLPGLAEGRGALPLSPGAPRAQQTLQPPPPVTQLLSQLGLHTRRPSRYDSPADLRIDRRDHGRVIVTQHLRGVMVGAVEKRAAIDIGQPTAVTTLEEQGVGRIEVRPLGTEIGRASCRERV